MAIRSDSRIPRSDPQEIFMIPGSSFAISGGRRQTNRHPDCDEATKLCCVSMHGRVRVDSEAEDFKNDFSRFNAAALCIHFNGDKIPVGFSSSLRSLAANAVNDSVMHVSIPVGFSSSLRLVGIVMDRLSYHVSIPVGFSSSLQLHSADYADNSVYRVSIPVGFSSSLQRMTSSWHHSCH